MTLKRMSKSTFEAVFAGTIGALAMMPAGLLFRALDMRIGHYGPKFAALYLTSPGPLALFAQHLIVGWVSAIPLCMIRLQRRPVDHAVALGALYGFAYYVAVNSIALPLHFGDALPWTLGGAVVIPSLVVHVIFGVAVAVTLRSLRLRREAV